MHPSEGRFSARTAKDVAIANSHRIKSSREDATSIK